MNPNSTFDFIRKKASAAWVWFMSFLAYVVSIVLPIIGSNVEKWLKPFLTEIRAPDFIQSDFTVYGTVFGVCGTLTMFAVKRLVACDVYYKSDMGKQIARLKKENKSIKAENKRISNILSEQESHKRRAVEKAVSECSVEYESRIFRLTELHELDLSSKDSIHANEVRRLNEMLRIQSVAMDAVANYKSIEANMEAYNESSAKRTVRMDGSVASSND